MPAHIKPRGSTYYLIDGAIRRSLKTKKKGLAESRLEQYIKGKFGLGPKLTWKEWYDEWIEADKAPFVRPGGTGDYEQHWKCYLRDEFAKKPLTGTTVGMLKKFRQKLTERGLSSKTCENIINSTFRAMWRDAMIEGHVETNPFALLQWPRQPRKRPDPYTAEERDAILKWWEEHDFFFYPYVYFQFHTGCRPSETAALEQDDLRLDDAMISINGSLVMGIEGATKTEGADRIIPIGQDMVEIIKILPSRALGIKRVFVGKRGNPMTKKWAEHNWKPCLDDLGIRYRKFSATRHTFITEAVKRGENLKVIADYTGTSVAMIEQDYCGRQAVGFDRTKPAQPKINSENYEEKMVAGPGFEPGTSRL